MANGDDGARNEPPAQPAAFEPPINAEELSAAAHGARLAHDRQVAAAEELLGPRIAGHLQACELAIDELVDAHRQLVEQTDIDLEAETRWVAIWELAGRCLSVARALIAQLRDAYAAETVGTMRVLHEAANLLVVAADVEEERLTRRWLAGEHVPQREARSHIHAAQERIVEQARERGVEIEGDVAELTRELYGILSQGAHNDRPGFADSVFRTGRVFSYGPHPNPLVRAAYVDYASELIEQIVMEVGDALAVIYGGDWYRETVRPLVTALHAVRDDQPIDSAVRARFGY